jgi:hypothetical protein
MEDALRGFEKALDFCKDLSDDQIFINQKCKLCQTDIRDPDHPTTKNHRRRLICRNLFLTWQAVHTNPDTVFLAEILAKIDSFLKTEYSNSNETRFLLWMDSTFWHNICSAGSHETRKQQLPDGAKIWFERFIFNLRLQIGFMKQKSDYATVSGLVEKIESTISELTAKKRKNPEDCEQVSHCRNTVQLKSRNCLPQERHAQFDGYYI